MSHFFVTDCVRALTGEDIIEMCDMASATEITTAHFISKIAPKLEIDQEVLSMLGYQSKKQFAADPYVSVFKSHYQGVPCYYIDHSRIEYVFVDNKHRDLVIQERKVAESRQYRLSDLQTELDELLAEKSPATQQAVYQTLKEFHHEHRDDLESYRIPMASLAQSRVDFPEAYVAFDKKYYGKQVDCSLQP